MPQIKSGRYTELPKGYLTYPIKGEKDTSGIQSVLLREKRKGKYTIDTDGIRLEETRVSKALGEALSKVGVHVRISKKVITTGRKSLEVTKGEKKVQLPVEIHKVMMGKELLDIQIRATGTTEGDLIENLNAIKNCLSVWHITPKECVWSQGAWQESSQSKEPVKERELEKELERLKSIVESQASDLAELKEAPIKRAMRDDRNVMKGVLG